MPLSNLGPLGIPFALGIIRKEILYMKDQNSLEWTEMTPNSLILTAMKSRNKTTPNKTLPYCWYDKTLALARNSKWFHI